MRKYTSCVVFVAVLLCAQAAWANFVNGDFSNPSQFVTQSSFVVGDGVLGSWYADGMGISSGGFLERTGTGVATSDFGTYVNNAYAAWQVLPMAPAGTYTVGYDFRGTNYDRDLFWVGVYAVKTGTTLNVSSLWPFLANSNYTLLTLYDPGAANTNGNWVTNVSTSFTLTAAQASTYQYLAFQVVGAPMDAGFMGDRTDYDNLTTSVPEPVTMAMLALGGLAMLRRRK
jgi:hypothetical protein